MATANRQRLTVWAGDLKVAMAASGVSEIVRAPRVTRMPNGPPSLLGVTHLRGQVLPIVSLAGLLGGEARAVDRVVVLARDPVVGLAVDGVEDLKALGEAAGDHADGQLLLDDAGGARWFDLSTALEAQFTARAGGARGVARSREALPGGDALAAQALAYLGFEIAGQSYALPLDAVIEVARLPDEVAGLPRTEDILVGVAERRDVVLPVLSTRALLGLDDPGLVGDERLVVTRIGAQALGLVVDRVEAILRVSPDRIGPAPSLFNRGGGEARIESVLRMPDGKGLVSVLSPELLLADERVMRLLALAEDVGEAEVAGQASVAARERFVVVRLGEERYGLPIEAVDEVIRLPEILTRLPKAPTYVQGVMNLRGRVVPIIDQRLRFAVPGERVGAGRVIVATMGPLQAGFAVDGVETILEIDSDQLLPAPELTDDGPRLFDRAVEHEGEVILLVDPKALLDRAEADMLRDLTEKSPHT